MLDEAKILIIDDEEDIVDLLARVLKREGFKHLITAYTGEEGIQLCKTNSPDLILLDIMLPDLSGYEVYHKLREMTQVPILFISAKTDEVDRLLGFALGADDYITKPFSPKEVAFRIKARLRRWDTKDVQEKPSQKICFGDVVINTMTGEVLKAGKPVELTAKELKLLTYFANNPNRILSKEMLCHQVWGEDFFGYDNTITVHIRKLRTKIEEDASHPQYLKTVIGLGYKLVIKEDV